MPKKKKPVHHRSSVHNHQFLTLFIVFLVSTLLFLVVHQSSTTSKPTLNQTVRSTTYSGTTPCADCEGIKTDLVLTNPDKYSLTLTYLGSDVKPYTESGTWVLEDWEKDPTRKVYTLTSYDTKSKMYYEVLNANQVRQLDGDGNAIPDSLPFTLTRTN